MEQATDHTTPPKITSKTKTSIGATEQRETNKNRQPAIAYKEPEKTLISSPLENDNQKDMKAVNLFDFSLSHDHIKGRYDILPRK